MIKNLKYNVTFTNPERTISRDLNFEQGLSAITGPNGMGKSLVLEMIQYALFGTKALRAPIAEYKKLETSLIFSVNGDTYKVNRNLKKVELVRILGDSWEDVASGTTAVNGAILSIFGYSYDVFRVANVAAQGEIEALGNMKPTERKRLIDETVGLNALDQLTEFIQAQVRDLSAQVKATEAVLVQPTEPTNPGLEPSQFYVEEEVELGKQKSLRDRYRAIAEKPLPVEPLYVELAQDAYRKEFYTEQNKKHDALVTEKNLLARELAQLPNTKYVEVKLEEDDDKLDVYQRYAAEKKRLETALAALPPRPTHTREELEAQEVMLKLVERCGVKKKLMSRSVSHQCPACSHKWEEVDPRVAEEFGDVPDTPPVPKLNPTQIRVEWVNIEALPNREQLERALDYYRADIDPEIDRILKARLKYQESETARNAEQRRRQLQERNEEIKTLLFQTPSRTEELDRLGKNELAVARYQEQKKSYDQAVAEREVVVVELKNFPEDLDQKVEVNKRNLYAAIQFEGEHKRYLKDVETYNARKLELETIRAELKDWDNGKKAIVDLRARVKGYLLPSLNTVSSHLINEMTGGVLSWIVVDEDFNITVEGQALETLSGSGKAVANLALRIALGQILTHKVMSTLMLDEIDASMDTDRAGYVAACLQRLTGSVKQIIQVSHKQGLVADHHISLGG